MCSNRGGEAASKDVPRLLHAARLSRSDVAQLLHAYMYELQQQSRSQRRGGGATRGRGRGGRARGSVRGRSGGSRGAAVVAKFAGAAGAATGAAAATALHQGGIDAEARRSDRDDEGAAPTGRAPRRSSTMLSGELSVDDAGGATALRVEPSSRRGKPRRPVGASRASAPSGDDGEDDVGGDNNGSAEADSDVDGIYAISFEDLPFRREVALDDAGLSKTKHDSAQLCKRVTSKLAAGVDACPTLTAAREQFVDNMTHWFNADADLHAGCTPGRCPVVGGRTPVKRARFKAFSSAAARVAALGAVALMLQSWHKVRRRVSTNVAEAYNASATAQMEKRIAWRKHFRLFALIHALKWMTGTRLAAQHLILDAIDVIVTPGERAHAAGLLESWSKARTRSSTDAAKRRRNALRRDDSQFGLGLRATARDAYATGVGQVTAAARSAAAAGASVAQNVDIAAAIRALGGADTRHLAKLTSESQQEVSQSLSAASSIVTGAGRGARRCVLATAAAAVPVGTSLAAAGSSAKRGRDAHAASVTAGTPGISAFGKRRKFISAEVDAVDGSSAGGPAVTPAVRRSARERAPASCAEPAHSEPDRDSDDSSDDRRDDADIWSDSE